jgi:hypothetical protein
MESENRTIFARQSVNGRATVADKVSISLKGDIVLPWALQSAYKIHIFLKRYL